MRARRQRNLSRHQKIFLQKRLSHKGYPPLWDRTIFGQVFVRRGMIKFSKWKAPLPGGGSAARQNEVGLRGSYRHLVPPYLEEVRRQDKMRSASRLQTPPPPPPPPPAPHPRPSPHSP